MREKANAAATLDDIELLTRLAGKGAHVVVPGDVGVERRDTVFARAGPGFRGDRGCGGRARDSVLSHIGEDGGLVFTFCGGIEVVKYIRVYVRDYV